jgi:hypothetical protein
VSEHNARKFARVVYDQHCHEGTFTIEVDELEAATVKSALEELGCIVKQEKFRPRLTVTCPEAVKR